MKRYIPILLCWLCVHTASAQKMRDVFATMPDSILKVMTKNNRLDCIDFIENDMEAKVRNRFDGYTVLKALTTDYLDLQLTPSTRVEMKLLPVTDSLNYICVVHTYSGPAEESTVVLYNEEWKALPKHKWIPQPLYADFWMENDSIDAAEVARLQHLQDMRFVKASLCANCHELVYELQPGEVEKKEAAKMQHVLRAVAYEWRDGQFRKKERR